MRALPNQQRSVTLVRHDSFLQSAKHDALRADKSEPLTSFLREKAGGTGVDPATLRVYVSCRATKVNKRGKWQTRIFILTAEWLYWFKDVALSRLKRPQNGVNLREVHSIELSVDEENVFLLRTVNDYEIRVDCGSVMQRAVIVYAIDVLARRCRGAASLREQGVQTLVHEEGAPDVRAAFINPPNTRGSGGGGGGAGARAAPRAVSSAHSGYGGFVPRRVVSPPGQDGSAADGAPARPPPAATSIATALADAEAAVAAAASLRRGGDAAASAAATSNSDRVLVLRLDPALGQTRWCAA